MNKKLNLIFIILTIVSILSGCAGQQLLRTDVRKDAKKEVIIQKDPVADISVDPETVQKQEKNGVAVEIAYLRKLNSQDHRCLKEELDPLNPKLLFAFRMLNTGDNIRYYNPIFIFKGNKSLDLAQKDPCKFFNTYGGVNYLLAKPGNKTILHCEEQDNIQAQMLQQTSSKPVILYPDVPIYGVLIVSQDELNNAAIDNNGVKVSTIKGWASFFEKAENRKPDSFRFNYEFTRKDWKEDMEYSKITPYTYKVNVYQKTTDTLIMGTINGDIVEKKVEGSEVYDKPQLEKIGPASKNSTK